MKSFILIGAVALAAGVSAQYTAVSVSTPVPTSIPGGCNPAHPGSCPSSYFQTMGAASSAIAVSSAPDAASSAPAASITTTITANAGCPTGPAPDVVVTRSDAPEPSCEAGGNATKPSIESIPGSGPAQSGADSGASGTGSVSGNGTQTATGQPAQFTGAAARTGISAVLAVVAGCVVWVL